jgi:hypothetical protein
MTNHYHELRIILLEVNYRPQEDEVSNSQKPQRKLGEEAGTVQSFTEVSERESDTQGLCRACNEVLSSTDVSETAHSHIPPHKSAKRYKVINFQQGIQR